jgi:uncharacterized protein with NRDE domain
MCLIAIAWRAHPEISLLVAANRDEWRARPTAAAQWWANAPQVLAGRDLEAGGTWMGVTRGGRFAALTNFRDPSAKKSAAPSRGKLVADFLRSDIAPKAYLQALMREAQRYNDFNLIVGEGATLMVLSSRDATIEDVAPGVHGLSNHRLDAPWPKVQFIKSSIEEVLGAEMPENDRLERSFAALSDQNIAPDDALPDTGVGMAWERKLSPALITGADYGTRSSTVLTMTRGMCTFEERTRDEGGHVTGVSQWRFPLEPPARMMG